MSYKINTTNGELLVDLLDGTIDDDTTDLVLVGRNYTGYGEAFNENFVKLLENFANTSQPNNPIRGQIWYDTGEGRLKIYDGENFKSTDTTIYTATEPTLLAGEIWIDSRNKQLYFSDGVRKFLAGPNFTDTQGATGTDAITLVDRFGNDKHVARMQVNGQTVAIISHEAFTAANIDENIALLSNDDFTFSLTIEQGINLSTDTSTFLYHGTAKNAQNLQIGSVNYSPADFLQVTPNIAAATPQATNHLFHVRNDRGIIIGDSQDHKIFVDTAASNAVTFKNQINGSDLKFQITQSVDPSDPALDVITVDNSTSRIGFFNAAPDYDIQFGTTSAPKDVYVTGDLTVRGDTTSLDVATLRVEDLNIELAIGTDSTLLARSALDGAGIVIKATGDDITFTYNNAETAWASTENIDIAQGKTYKIGGQTVITSSALDDVITTANGLTSIGTLTELDVDNFNFNAGTITVSSALTFDVTGDITIDANPTPTTKIKGVSNPDDPQEVATKDYVDNRNRDEDIWLAVDTTGLNDAQIADLIEDIVPASTKRQGVSARVHCTSYSGTVSYDPDDGISKTTITVDKGGVADAQSVLQDVSFAETTESLTLSVTRQLKRFEIDSAQEWVWIEDLLSSV